MTAPIADDFAAIAQAMKGEPRAKSLPTRQEIFDKVASHLFAQGRKATDESGDCSYRGQDGLICAIGILFPDKLYDSYMEGRRAGEIANDWPEIRPFLGLTDADANEERTKGSHGRFLIDLQDAHDGWSDASVERYHNLKEILGTLARNYGLSTAMLNEIAARYL